MQIPILSKQEINHLKRMEAKKSETPKPPPVERSVTPTPQEEDGEESFFGRTFLSQHIGVLLAEI
jgi:hypothetical protein